MADKDVEIRREELVYQFRRHAKLSGDINASVATVGVWASIAAVAIFLGGPLEAPMVAGTMTTIVIWALRRME